MSDANHEFRECQVRNIRLNKRTNVGGEHRYSAALICPRTDPEGKTFQTGEYKFQPDATTILSQLAMESLCPSCPYSGRSPTEVEVLLTEKANAETTRIKAELRLLEDRQVLGGVIGVALEDLSPQVIRPPIG